MKYPRIDEVCDLDDFESWLIKNGQQTVGLACDERNCPLSKYLSEKLGQSVEVHYLGFEVSKRTYLHTDLTLEFVQQIDNKRTDHQSVSGEEALVALNMARDIRESLMELNMAKEVTP